MDAPDLHRLVGELPQALRPLAAQLVDQPLRTLPELRAEVEAHRDAALRAAADGCHPDLDVVLAIGCASACLQLLAHAEANPPALAAAQLACRWFAESDDDEDDFDSLIGFDDDALVINAAARAVGRPDLVLPVPDPDP